jgi:preprotein translocase subunit SecA
LVEYDDVLTRQREIVYRRRRKILEGDSQKDTLLQKFAAEIANVVAIYSVENTIDREKIITEFTSIIPFDPNSQEQLVKQLEQLHTEADITEFLTKISGDVYAQREKQVGEEVARQIERWVSLQVIDNLWMDHLDAIDDLREGIGLRGYGQRDPLVEYKNEAFSMFERLVATIDSEIVHRIFKVQVQLAPNQQNGGQQAAVPIIPKAEKPKKLQTNASQDAQPKAPKVNTKTLSRNDPCWCGSGKKWKKCHYPKLG